MTDTDFDPRHYVLTPEQRVLNDRARAEKDAREARKSAPKPKRGTGFIKVPVAWEERLWQARLIGTYRVALRILYLHWWKKVPTFPLANGDLGRKGVSRWTKHRALAELEQLGLIRVEYRDKKSPIVTVLVTS